MGDSSTNAFPTEEQLRHAVKIAEAVHGERSAEAGLSLIELADFLERAGKLEEAEKLTGRYRAILLTLASDSGISY